jgi:glyoxylase-like metal-dependent hydrolase (beta-lactamase superfamily II)
MKNDPKLLLKQIQLGPMGNNIYIVGDLEKKEALVVDPAWDIDVIRQIESDTKIALKGVYCTHCHPDHTNGIGELLRTHNIPVYVSEKEAFFYAGIKENLKILHEDNTNKIGDMKIKILHTPGHSPGSLCFLIDNFLISGDTLFIDGCGRCDLPGSDVQEMYNSIYNKIMKLPDNTIVLPGHKYHNLDSDDLGSQKKTNKCMNFSNMENFKRYLLG